jgi:hypothetical protein
MSATATPNLKEACALLHIRNILKKCCISAFAIFFSSPQLQVGKAVEMMLRSCLSAYPQSQFFPAISNFLKEYSSATAYPHYRIN